MVSRATKISRVEYSCMSNHSRGRVHKSPTVSRHGLGQECDRRESLNAVSQGEGKRLNLRGEGTGYEGHFTPCRPGSNLSGALPSFHDATSKKLGLTHGVTQSLS